MSTLDHAEKYLKEAERSPWLFFGKHSVREMQMTTHPDRHPEDAQRAGEIFVRFQEAYLTLNPDRPRKTLPAVEPPKVKQPVSRMSIFGARLVQVSTVSGWLWGLINYGFLASIGFAMLSAIASTMLFSGILFLLLYLKMATTQGKRK